MPYKGNRRKKRRTHQPVDLTDDKTPRSFVFSRGDVSPAVQTLVQNIRRIMSPNSADSLKVKKSNKMKDFINVAGPLGVTHFWIFTQSKLGVNMRLIRVPHGPTLTFRVEKFSLCRDIASFQKRPENAESGLRFSPLSIFNNFGQGKTEELMGAMFSNMFPALQVKKVKLSQCTRVCLFDYDEDDETIELRHYRIKVSPVGLNRNIKRIVKGKKYRIY
eukprot:UN29585